MKLQGKLSGGAIALLVLFFMTMCLPLPADCTFTTSGLKPLPDMGTQTYGGFAGGLYPGGSNLMPAAHAAAGLSIGNNEVVPRDSAGNPAPLGKIVLISIGMSNTTQEFASGSSNAFKPRADGDPAKRSEFIIVDGAQGGQTAQTWANPNANCWNILSMRLANAGVTTDQVQMAWFKEADANPSQFGAFPSHALILKSNIAASIRNAKAKYPNLKIGFLSSRTRAWRNDAGTLNPEPYAYESGYSVRWIIEDQHAGTGNLNFDAAAGTVTAPWLAWGPYLWADGTNPRSDGFVWNCADTQADFVHPSPLLGVGKVGDQLLNFFRTDPVARLAYLKAPATGQSPNVTVTPSATTGAPPLTVVFNTTATDPDGISSYNWNFRDGTFSKVQNPTKTFHTVGTYTVFTTVLDTLGNSTIASNTITVTANARVEDWTLLQ